MMKARFLLLMAAFFWGATLVAQRVSTGVIGGFTFLAARYFLGTLSLLPLVYWEKRYKTTSPAQGKAPFPLWAAAGFMALLLTGGTGFQQMGIFYTTAGKAGFITSLYIVLVPFISCLMGRPLYRSALAGSIFAVIGLFLLAYPENGGALNRGDILIGICSVIWSVYIIVIGRISAYYPGFRFIACEFFIAGIYNLILAFLSGEMITGEVLMAAIVPIMYCGCIGGGLAYSFQMIGQRDVPPAEASLILSMETIFGVLSGWLFLGEVMSGREMFGAVLMAIGIVLAQLPSKVLYCRK
jgi:drug/metabolite transporter (DMT)-like permease